MLVIRNWLALPYAFKGLAEGKPAVEVLDDPSPLPGLEYIDCRIQLAVRDDDRVFVYATPDPCKPTECPPHLVRLIPDDAWNWLI